VFLRDMVCLRNISVDTLHIGDTENVDYDDNNNNNNKKKKKKKCTIIPVIIGATEIVTKSLKKKLEAVPRKHSIDSLQKTAILGTSHIIRKVLQCEA
jgi:hypothetical protein